MSESDNDQAQQERRAVDRVVRTNAGPRGIRLRRLAEGEAAQDEPVRRPALVAVQLALAISWQRALARGLLQSQSGIAQVAGVTRARVTQLMNLTLLAPDIQEDVLFLEAVDGVEPVGEHTLRQVLRAGLWPAQTRGLEEAAAAWRARSNRGGGCGVERRRSRSTLRTSPPAFTGSEWALLRGQLHLHGLMLRFPGGSRGATLFVAGSLSAQTHSRGCRSPRFVFSTYSRCIAFCLRSFSASLSSCSRRFAASSRLIDREEQ